MFTRRSVLNGLTLPPIWSASLSANVLSLKPIDPLTLSYAQALEVSGSTRLLFISGQVPEDDSGFVPEHFEDQARLVWANIAKLLAKANMSFANLVKVTTFLSDRRYRAANSAIRQEVLGPLAPAITVVIADIYSEEWLLEIEATAAA